MTDDRIDDLVERGSQLYNQPGPVPRDVMWERIQAARAAHRDASPPAIGGWSTTRRLWIWPGAAVAAVALLTLGIGLGRLMERRTVRAGPDSQLAASSVTLRRHPDSGEGSDSVSHPERSERVPATAGAAVAVAPESDTQDVVRRLHDETNRTRERVRQLANASTPTPASSTEPARVGSATDALEYRLVLLQHLAGAEALITAFRTSAKEGRVDAQLASWSRDLVSTTRMLESSRAASDPVMKRLLEDLDLVLTEIAHYATTGTYEPDDLDVIEHAITRRAVMTRLRTTIPRT